MLTISEFTARDVKRFLEQQGLRRVPVEAVPLSHVLHGKKSRRPMLWSDALVPLEHRPFVLSVSTIEARKNHTYLLSIWKLFIEEGLDPPDLVFVGRYGWRVADLMEQLRATNFMDGRVHVLHDLSDPELEQLYDACLFTAFPSFVEGWGLPIGESLAHGRPCVASNTSSMPEVGGDLVDYVDPYNLRNGIEVLRRMAFDSAYRAQARRLSGKNSYREHGKMSDPISLRKSLGFGGFRSTLGLRRFCCQERFSDLANCGWATRSRSITQAARCE